MDLSAFHPYVYYATRYPFAHGQSSAPRICYSSSIYLISEGCGTLRIGERTYEAGPGSLFYVPAGQPHEWLADVHKPMVHICCYFDWHYVERTSLSDAATPICYQFEQLQQEFVGPLFPYTIPEMVVVDSIRVWIDLFQSFYKSGEFINERTFMRSLTAQRNFQTFIDYFLTYMLQDSYIPDPRIGHLLDQMDKDLLNGTLQKLEFYYDSLHLSRGHFFDIFKKTTGYSPVQYINRLRISQAKEDLLHSSLSISKIAEKHHFSSVHYFSRLFHKQTGQSPSDFRVAHSLEAD